MIVKSAAELRRELDVILTVPLVQQDAPASAAAVPVSQMAQMPAQRSAAQKPMGKPPQGGVGTPARNSPPGGAAAKKPEADKSVRAPLPPAKSNTPLFASLGIAAVVGIGAFVMFSGGKKTPPVALGDSAPPAKSASVASSTPKPAASSLPTPKTTTVFSSSSLPSISPTGWQPLFTQAEWRVSDDDREFVDGLLHVKRRKLLPRAQSSADGAIRVRIIYRDGTRNPFVVARSSESDGHYVLGLGTDAKHVFLGYFKTLSAEGNILARHFLPRPLASGDGLSLELILQGDRLIGLVNGAPVIDAHDTHLQQPGRWGIYAGPGWFESVEVQPLGALATTVAATAPAPSVTSSPSPKVTASSDSKFPPGQWVKLFTKAEDLPEDLRKDGVTFEDGWWKASNTAKGLFAGGSSQNWKNAGMRFRARCADKKVASIAIRDIANRSYQINPHATTNTWHLKYFDPTTNPKSTLLGESPFIPNQLAENSEYVLELAAVGDRVIARVDSKLVASVTDQRLTAGRMSAFLLAPIRDIEVINLDGLSEAEALKILGVDEKGNDLRKPAAVAATAPAASISSSPSLPASKSSDSKFPPGQWVKLFTKFEDLPEGPRKKDMKFEDGWLINESNDRNPMHLPDGLGNNCAIRIRIRRGAGKTAYRSIALRVGGRAMYGLQLDTTFKCSYIVNAATGTSISNLSVPVPEIGNEYTLEFAVLGNRLFGRYNNKLLVNAVNNTLPTGIAYVSGIEPIRDIEVINLDGLSEAEALRTLGVDEKGNDLRALAAKQEQQMAEQAKAADAMAAIPELKTLHEQFVKLTAERVTAPFAADVAKLNAGYIGGIDRKIAEEKAAGHLDGIIALEAEKKLLADQQPIPADDAEGTTANLKALRAIYRAAYAKIETARVANLKQLTDPLTLRLKQLEADLTKKDRVPDAKTVREYREKLSEGGADTPVRTSTNGGAAATMNEADKSARAPLKKFPPGDDRKAAEWVLSVGGHCKIRDRSGAKTITNLDDLPEGRFDIYYIGLDRNQPTKANPDTFETLAPLANLKSVETIETHFHPISDSDTEVFATLPQLKGLLITDSKSFAGERLGELASLDQFVALRFQKSAITKRGLEQISMISGLEVLDLGGTPVQNEDINLLQKLKKLQSLQVESTQVTPPGIPDFKDLQTLGVDFTASNFIQEATQLATRFKNLSYLIVHYDGPLSGNDLADVIKLFPRLSSINVPDRNNLNDDTVTALGSLRQLKKVQSTSAFQLTDAALTSLSASASLEEITLEKSPNFSNAGLMALSRIKNLKKLNLKGSSSITEANWSEFRKARPDVTVER